MFKFRKVVVTMFLSMLVVGLIAPSCTSQPAPAASEKEVSIGILGSLTGALRTIGEGAVSAKDYFTEINDTQGGIKYKDPSTGKEEVARVDIMLGDHGWDTAKCISLYQRFKAAGMKFTFANGSAPAAALYTSMARDQIPGIQINCTSDPYIYDLPEPYLAINMPDMPTCFAPLMVYVGDQLRQQGIARPKVGLMCADVATRRVYDNDEEFGFLTYCREVAKIDLVGPIYIGIAPLDVRAEFTQLLNADVDYIIVDHWGDGACRVILNDAITLGIHKKGIPLNINNIGTNVVIAEKELVKEYNQDSQLYATSAGYAGSEPREALAKYPGPLLAYDIAHKYHGKSAAEMGGWYFYYGVRDALIGYDVIKQTLERTGYDGLSGQELRKTLFGLETIDTQGFVPTYHPDPNALMTHPAHAVVEMYEGGFIFDPHKHPWISWPASRTYPNYKVTFTPEWEGLVFEAPNMPPELMAPR